MRIASTIHPHDPAAPLSMSTPPEPSPPESYRRSVGGGNGARGVRVAGRPDFQAPVVSRNSNRLVFMRLLGGSSGAILPASHDIQFFRLSSG